MRLWTIHPKHLDAKGLVALWREALLAQKVLKGETQGYRNHPQLIRFMTVTNPPSALASYLAVVYEESMQRGYCFDGSKIGANKYRGRIKATTGQLLYEWSHLMEKLSVRDRTRYLVNLSVSAPDPHPLFRLVDGEVEAWEKRPSMSE